MEETAVPWWQEHRNALIAVAAVLVVLLISRVSIVAVVVNGLQVGAVYALVALGIALVYKSTRVLNFAQGDLLMLGAYTTFILVASAGINFWVAVGAALIASFVLGFAIERLVLRPMVGEPAFSIVMVTIGVAWMMRGLAGLFFGHSDRRLPWPLAGERMHYAGVSVSAEHLASLVAMALAVLAFFLFFRRSRWGVAMRASASDQDAALLMGIDVNRIAALSWSLAAMVATLAGVALGTLGFLFVHMGDIGFRAFPAAVVGGLDSPGGAVIGGLALGVLENLGGGYFSGAVKELTAWLVLLIVLVIRPYGLFGTPEIERV